MRAIRATYQPQLDRAGLAEQTAYQRWETTHHRARDLEVAIADQQRDLTAGIARPGVPQPHAYQALDVLRDGDRPLARHRARVRVARKDLLGWARRWEPILPELTPHTDDPRQGAEHVAAVMDRLGQAPNGEDRVRQAISSYATDILAAAHREHDTVVAEAELTDARYAPPNSGAPTYATSKAKSSGPIVGWPTLPIFPGTSTRPGATSTPSASGSPPPPSASTTSPVPPRSAASPPGASRAYVTSGGPAQAEDQQAALAQARRRAAMAQARAAEEAARGLWTPAPDPLRPSGRDYGPGMGCSSHDEIAALWCPNPHHDVLLPTPTNHRTPA